MKTVYLIIGSIFFISSCFSQQHSKLAFPREITYRGERAYYNDTPFTGLLISENTNAKWGVFRNGYKNGLFTEYYPNGRKKSKGNYINGVNDGIYTKWFNNGQLMVKYNFAQGKIKDGEYIIYQSNGQKAKQETYADGVIISQGIFKGGLLYKSIIEKYFNGIKKREGYTKNGLKDGLWTEWYENGQKSIEGKYKDGKKEGIWTWWYNNEDKKKEELYEMGQEVKLIYENNLNPALSIKANRKPGSYIYRIIDRIEGDTAYVMVVMHFDIMTVQNRPNTELTSFLHDLIASFTEERFQKMTNSEISINEDKPLSYSIEFSKLKWEIKRFTSKIQGQFYFKGSINLDMKISNIISDRVIFNNTLESYDDVYYSYDYPSSLAVLKSLPYAVSGQIIINIYKAFKLKARIGKIIKLSRKGVAKEVSVSDDLSSLWKGFCFLVYTEDDTQNSIAKIEKVNNKNNDHRFNVTEGGEILAKYVKQGKPLVAISCYKF